MRIAIGALCPYNARMLQSLILSFAFILLSPLMVMAQIPGESPPAVAHAYLRATVTTITPVENPNDPTDTLTVELEIQDKHRAGQKITTLWSNNQKTSRTFQVKEGQKVIVLCTSIEGKEACDIIEQQRTGGLIALLLLFAGVVWFVTRQRGVRAMLTMALGLAVILLVIVPLITAGFPPLLVTIIGGIAILVPTIYISHGFTAKSHIALVAILLASVIIGLLALAFSSWLNLVGSNSEEAVYLSPTINLRAILLSAILLGALGVIDDIAMTQVSIVNELYHSNSKLSPLSLYKRAMRVGQDHIASVLNTLFLAYAGVSLPLLLLIQQNQIPTFVALQEEPVVTEIMRTIVGTIGLVLVVPVTTYLAAQAITRFPHRFPPEEHHHSH